MPNSPNLTKIAADGMEVCVMSHIGPDEIPYPDGDRLRVNHADVVRNPVFYVPEGLATDVVHAIREQRFPGAR